MSSGFCTVFNKLLPFLFAYRWSLLVIILHGYGFLMFINIYSQKFDGRFFESFILFKKDFMGNTMRFWTVSLSNNERSFVGLGLLRISILSFMVNVL